MTRDEAKEAFAQIEYPEDQIGSVFFGVVFPNKDVQIKTALIQRGKYQDTVDEIYEDNPNCKILFQPNLIHDSIIEALKAERDIPTDLINDVYIGTKNEEHKKFIEDGKYLENA